MLARILDPLESLVVFEVGNRRSKVTPQKKTEGLSGDRSLAGFFIGGGFFWKVLNRD